MKKVFLFLASCLVTFAAGAKTVSVSNSDLEWEENTSGEMEARIVIGDIGCSDVTLNFTGGNASKVPCYRVAIIDNGDPEYDYWHELSDWNDILEVNSSGNGSTTISLTACGQTNRVIAFFIQLDKNPNIPQYTVSVQSDYSYWGTVTGGGTYDKGELVKITATPYEGYVFKEWSDGNTDNPRYLTVSSNINLTAYFEQPDFQYEINSDGRTVTLTKARDGIEVANIPSIVTINGKSYTVTKIGDKAFRWCTELVSVTIPNTVTSIGEEAFWDCNITSITIPNSVTSIERWAFIGCENLASVIIPNSVTTIGEQAFSDCRSLTSITIPNSVRTIDFATFDCCESLTSITIPNSVTTIGELAFRNCESLTSITIPNSVTSVGSAAFLGCDKLTFIKIDSDADVSEADLEFTKNDIRYRILSKTSVEITYNEHYDEEKDIWISDYLGDFVIPDSVEMTNNTYVVTGIGEYAFYCSSITSITIPNIITTIGEGAFYNCTGLTSIILPKSVNSINAGAFEECANLTSIMCLAEIPPIISEKISDCGDGYDDDNCYKNPFNTGGRNVVTVYVPNDAVTLYKVALDWRNSPVDIQPIPAENVSLSKDEVVVNVEKTTADFSMPANESANSYTLTIRNNGVTFCTLTFNANGQLTDIDFSTTKSYELKADVSAFKFTVTGLSEASDYRYSFKVLNASKAVLKEYVGSFTTKNADGTGGSTSGGGEGTLAIDNISPINTVAIVNNQILVNGEAPAFVVTVSGKKIANANLKAGVYFVVADGKTVGVSVR